MAQNYDVSLKALFLREGDGIIRRRLFGGRVTEHLATEQPQVSNHRADSPAMTGPTSPYHCWPKATNRLPLRWPSPASATCNEKTALGLPAY